MNLILFTQTNCNLSQSTKKFLLDKIEGFQEVNLSRYREKTEQFSIKSTPTLILFKDTNEVDRVVGFNPNSLTKLIKKYTDKKELEIKEKE